MHKQTILIGDDEDAHLELLETKLGSEYEILRATTGRQVLEKAREVDPDLVLLDVLMPEMNGYDVCKTLKADTSTRAIPVILVTALGETTDIVRGLEAGAEDYVVKPYADQELRARIKTHLERARLERELLRSERFRTLQRIMAGICEGIALPLESVEEKLTTMSSMLSDPAHKGLVESIGQNTQQMGEILQKLTDYVTIKPAHKDSCPIDQILDMAAGLAQFTWDMNKIGVDWKIADDLPPVTVDQQQMTQAFINLLTNAANAMPEGGTIQIETGKDGGWVFGRISDSGVGVPAGDLEKIFEPFFTTREGSGASGLGLSVAQRIVDEHGGSIEVESTKGEGSSFTLRLPCIEVVDDVEVENGDGQAQD